MNKRFLALMLSLLFLLPVLFFPAEAETPALPDISNANAVYFCHPQTGRVICAKNETRQIAAGSLPKVMSGLLLCETFATRGYEIVTVSSEMLNTPTGYRQYGLKGKVISVEELLYLALCGCYNDAYDVLIYLATGGNPKSFVETMNVRAKSLGATSTLYTDATGVADSSLTTARDQYLVAKAASENELYLRITSTERSDLFDPPVYNYNPLLSNATESGYYNSKCKGMAAGETTQGGHCLATQVQNGSDTYLCIVLGGEKVNDVIYSYVTCNRLVTWVTKNLVYLEVICPKTDVCSIPVTVSDMKTEVKVRTDQSLSALLPTGTVLGSDLTYSIRLLYDSVEAPVEEGTFVGYVAVLYRGENLGTLPLYTAENAERSGLISRLMSIRSLTKERGARAGIAFFALAMTAWIVAECLNARHKRHKWDKYFAKKLEAPQELARADRKKAEQRRK